MAVTIASASAVRPRDTSQRGDSGTRRRMIHTTAAPNADTPATHRHPATPQGSRGTHCHARNAAEGTARNWTKALKAKAPVRIRLGTNSARYASIVTNSTPIPTPAKNLQR